MSKASAARRLAAAAAFGGGGLGLLGGSFYGLLRAQAKFARHVIGRHDTPPPNSSGVYGRGLAGHAIRLSVLGDSAACGYGMADADETTGALLAAGLAELAQRPVRVVVDAAVGAESKDLDAQTDRALTTEPDVVAIIVGANDVTHTVRPSQSVRYLEQAVRRLRDAGCAVVVGTCPDLGTVRPISPPLRQVARLWSRRLAAAQTIVVVEAGGRSVSLGSILGPEFDAAPAELFGLDRFHPSAAGYESLASAMLPTLAAALGLVPEAQEAPQSYRGEGVMPVAYAAAEAVGAAGTEVAPAEVDGRRRGPRGLWVALRHRRRRPLPAVDRLEEEQEAARESDHESEPETAGGLS